MEKAAATVHPIGHAHHIPIGPKVVLESMTAKPTLKIRSVMVAIINLFIMLDPRKMPSATNFTEITK